MASPPCPWGLGHDPSALLRWTWRTPTWSGSPGLQRPPFLSCVLCPGDVLFIPAKCWHYVRALDLGSEVGHTVGAREPVHVCDCNWACDTATA